MLDGLRKNLADNKKTAMQLKNENIQLESKTKEKSNELSKLIYDDLINFEKDLKRVIQNDRSETEFLSQQLKSLDNDKLNVQKQELMLRNKMKKCEDDIGVKYSY